MHVRTIELTARRDIRHATIFTLDDVTVTQSPRTDRQQAEPKRRDDGRKLAEFSRVTGNR